MRANSPAHRGAPLRSVGTPSRAPVDLIVLSTDHTLLALMQSVASGDLLVSAVASAEGVVESLVAGRCGILLVDLLCLRGDVAGLLSRLNAQFPGLVLMAAGRREDQGAVAQLIAAGVIYRYVHKPLSPGRAQQFLQAALRRHRELNEREPFGLATVRELVRVQLWERMFRHSVRIVGVAAGVVVTALIVSTVWNALDDDRQPAMPSPSLVATPEPPAKPRQASRTEPLRSAPAETADASSDGLLREAQQLIELGRLNDATRVVRRAGAKAPDDARVAIVATTIGERLLMRANVAIGEHSFALAERRLEAARQLDHEFNLGLPDLQATQGALVQSRAAAEKDALHTVLQAARAHREAGDLLAPAGANAYEELQRARTLAPDDEDVRAEAQALAFALLNRASQALDEHRSDEAERFLRRADELVPDMSAARELRRKLQSEAAAASPPP